MNYIETDFLGTKIKLSKECEKVLGAYRGGIYELNLIEHFYSLIPTYKETILFDVGANTGAFTFIPIKNPNVKCFAFEPNPIAFNILVENVKLNELEEKVNCYNNGLWSENKKLELKVPNDLTDSGLSTFGDNPTRFIYDDKSGEYTNVEIECITIDSFVESNAIKNVDFIKIDTEGSELNILMGAQNTLTKFKPKLLLEFDDKNTSQFGYNRGEILKLLENYGYNNAVMLTESDILVEFN